MSSKFIFCLAIFWCVHFENSYSQSVFDNIFCECDTLVQSGYLLVFHTKDEIKELYKNNKRKNENKSYNLIYSLSGAKYVFIPFDKINKNSDFCTIFDNFTKNKSKNIYTLYSSINVANYKSLRGMENQFSLNWPNLDNNNYYEIKAGNSKYCFQIYILRSQWIRFKLKSINDAFNFVGREAKILDKNEANFNIFILKNIFECSCLSDIKYLPIKLWKIYKH